MTTPTIPPLPPEAIRAAAEALTDYPEPDCTGRLDCTCGSMTGVTVAALTAALPHIEAAVRERVAKDIEAERKNPVRAWNRSLSRHIWQHFHDGMETAESIAREGAAG